MRVTTLEIATRLIEDPQAAKRGYIDDQSIVAINQIAAELASSEWIGTMGSLANVGQPHQWYVENSPKYKEWSMYFSEGRFADRRWGYVCEMVDWCIAGDKRERLESKYASLELLRKAKGLSKEEDSEYLELSRVLKFPAKV